MKGAGPNNPFIGLVSLWAPVNPCIFCSPLHQGYLVPWLVFIVLVLRAFTWWFTFSLDIAKIKRCLLFLTLRLSTMLSLMPHQSFSGYANYKRILVFIYLLWSCSVVQIFYNDVFHGKTKHIEIDFHLIRHHLLQGMLQLHFVSFEDQLANIFTKFHPLNHFNDLLSNNPNSSKLLETHHHFKGAIGVILAWAHIYVSSSQL